MSDFDFKPMFDKIRAGNERVKHAALKAVDQFGEAVLTASAPLVPVGGGSHSPRDPAPGTLLASAFSEPAKVEGDTITKRIGYNTVYAAVQHEDLEFGHDQGQALYLKQPLDEMRDKFAPFVAEKVKPAMEGA
jgi:hypothetical protein